MTTCFYCAQPVGLLTLPRGYSEHWCTYPVGSPGSACCPAQDDETHTPIERSAA